MPKFARDFVVSLLVIMVAAVALQWFAAGPGGSPLPPAPPRPKPQPEVVLTTKQSVVIAMTNYAAGLEAVFSSAADAIDRGDVTNPSQLSKFLEQAKPLKAAMLDPVYEDMNRTFGPAKWNPQKPEVWQARAKAWLRDGSCLLRKDGEVSE